MEHNLTFFEQLSTFFNNIVDFVQLHIIHRLEHIELNDVFDIAILAVIFYFLFKFILNKRAARLALGLVILVLVMVLSWFFEMKAVMMFFETFYQAGIIAIIIMFQPELRSALEKIGNAPISNIKHISNDNKSFSYVSNSIATITKTVCDLSLEKTGALIVIERETKLGEHIKTGTFINAQLSSQLLKNLFYNKAPLHDGAVILRNYRIYSAGCFLPLSTNDELDDNIGTRHRAAIGITEVSDAVAIIVSEETGRISIACDGELKQNYSYKSLKKELSNILTPEKEEKTPRIKKGNTRKSENKEDVAK